MRLQGLKNWGTNNQVGEKAIEKEPMSPVEAKLVVLVAVIIISAAALLTYYIAMDVTTTKTLATADQLLSVQVR